MIPGKRVGFVKGDTTFGFTQAQKIALKNWIARVAAAHLFKIGQLTYIACSDEYLLHLNRESLDHDFYTDILTFPLEEPHSLRLSGDIFISLDRVKENAANLGIAYNSELRRVMIHGVLHLMGFDDQGEEGEAMRHREDAALQLWE